VGINDIINLIILKGETKKEYKVDHTLCFYREFPVVEK